MMERAGYFPPSETPRMVYVHAQTAEKALISDTPNGPRYFARQTELGASMRVA